MTRLATILATVAILATTGPANAISFLAQSTTATIQLGPFLDTTDGNTTESALTLAQADVMRSSRGGAYHAKNDANAATHDAAGWYRAQLNDTDTSVTGSLVISVHQGGALPVWREFWVLPANLHAALLGTDYAQTDAMQIEGVDATMQLDTAANTAADTVTVTSMGANTITSATIATNAIGATEIAADAIGASEIAADASTEIWAASTAPTSSTLASAVWASVTRTLTALGTGIITADSIAANAITSSEIADGAITDAKVANDVQVDILTIETVDATTQLDTAADTVTVTSMGSGTITAAAIATDAIGAAEIAADAIGASEMAATAHAENWEATTRTLTATPDTGATLAKQNTILELIQSR